MNTSTEQEQKKSEMEDTSAEADAEMKKALDLVGEICPMNGQVRL